MELLKGTNLLVRFLLELCMLAAVGYWGFKTQSSWALKVLLGIGVPVLIAVLWGLFVAPKAAYPLQGLSRLALEVVLFGVGAFALFASGKANLGWIYIAVLAMNEALLFVWKQ
jgi:hypothetical protein